MIVCDSIMVLLEDEGYILVIKWEIGVFPSIIVIWESMISIQYGLNGTQKLSGSRC